MLAAGAQRNVARVVARRLPVETFGGDGPHERVRALVQARELFVEAADYVHRARWRGQRAAHVQRLSFALRPVSLTAAAMFLPW